MANYALVNSFFKFRFGPSFPQPPPWKVFVKLKKLSSAQRRWLKLQNEHLKSESGMAESEHANSAIVENSVGCHMNYTVK